MGAPMKEPLPLDGNTLIKWWWNHPDGARNLYQPQGYEGLTSEDRVTELYAMAVIDFDLEIFYCISVRHRPYLNGVTVNGKIPEDMEEVRDHLFVAVELLKRYPEQPGPTTRYGWMNRPHHPFDEDSPKAREVMTAFMDFIENLPHSPCTALEARWCPVHGDCTCPQESGWEDLDDESCPLHSLQSDHPLSG